MKFNFLSKNELEKLPRTSGVYTFFARPNPEGKGGFLYIGKAANVRDRVKNHFQQPSYRDHLFIDKVTRVGYIGTQSDIDALLLESQLIKKFQPKYNVLWKDSKQYFYVGITKDTLPFVFLTHQPTQVQTKNYKLKTKYIGPFVEGKAIKKTLQLLRRIFPYYASGPGSGRAHPAKKCPWCHLNLCPGPSPNAREYRKNIKNLAAVLEGKRLSVLKNLKKEMEQTSKKQRYEEAAKLRDQVRSLENIISHSDDLQKTLQSIFKTKKEITRIEAYDISNMQGKEATGSMVTFLQGKPAKNWYRKFKIRLIYKSYNARLSQTVGSDPNDFAMMEEIISRRMNHPEWPYPDLMVIDGGKGQLTAALKALGNFQIKVAAIAKRNNELFLPGKSKPILLKNLPQSFQNLVLHIRDEAHRFAITYHRKLRVRTLLDKN